MAKKSKYVYVNGTIGDQSTEALIARHKTKLSSESIGRRKSKYTRRRAIDCKLIERSKNNPGYCKYMQGALSRLMNRELTVKVEKKLETNTGLIFIAWLLLMGTPAIIFGAQDTPWYLALTFGTIIMLMAVTSLWYNYIKKGEV